MLVIRVKRHRDDEPAENICVFDDKGKGSEENHSQGNKLLLKRMKTLDYDTALSSHKADMYRNITAGEASSSLSATSATTSKVMIPINKKRVFSVAEEVVLVDLAQVESHSAPSSSTPATNKIMAPASRLLQKGILVAMDRGNFDDLSFALIQGADADVQTAMTDKYGGYTALMAAAAQSNIRMVKRLLLKDVNPTLTNKEGLGAVDLMRETRRNRDTNLEIRLLLQSAIAKFYSNQRRQGVRREPSSQEAGGDYVMDIYCVPRKTAASDGATTAAAAAAAAGQSEEVVSVVQIEGLGITAEGEVQVYDNEHCSDWSDLGDDEEPDSNDERWEGNDYPEEEEEDDIAPYDEADEADAALVASLRAMGISTAVGGGAAGGAVGSGRYDTEVDPYTYSDDEGGAYAEPYDDEGY